MHRFRKKSDAKRSQVPNSSDVHPVDVLPELPPTNDFRTSLILPDLSRRFSLLRSATGDPVPILKTRLANQRARGAPNQISEEEEDMLLETLGRLRSRGTASPGASQEHVIEGGDGVMDSVGSTGASTSSVTSSPRRSTKRYSNNLFGSGRLRDYSYLKSVASSKGSGSSTRTVSLTPTEGSTKDLSKTDLRPVTPEGSNASSSTRSSPVKPEIHSAPLFPPAPYGESSMQALSAAEYRLQKTLGPSALKRASVALEEAIKEIEDEVEDEILLPRSVPIPRGSLDHPAPEVRHSDASNVSSVYEAGMAISIDQTIHDEFSERRASPIPTRTVPGYVPGMPRPMTPRDFDFDEQRSHSTTPRAQSPFPDLPVSPILPNISTTKIRRASVTSTARPSPITPMSAAPLFLQRSTNGRYTPDDSQQRPGSGDASDLDNNPSSITTRRRPASPLSSPPFQPMAVTNRPLSRPTTPSNVIWTPNLNNNQKTNHSRNTSWTTDGGTSSSDYHNSTEQSKQGQRPLRSPPLLDTPMFDFSQPAPFSFSSATNSSIGQIGSSEQPHAFLPDVGLGSSTLPSTHSPRSGTPTQNNSQRSPISPTFSNFERNGGSKRSSRQNPPSSPFNISSFPSLGFAPHANSSRSSLDSVGSSFHSWDETDKVLSLFSDSKEQQPVAWHHFGANDKSSSGTPGNGSPDEEEWDPEKIIQRYAGLKKADIAAIQEKLVVAAFTKIANTDPRDRAPSSMRRRRPSTSQSNYARVASPPPQLQPPASPSPYATDDQFSRASALLNAVVDSIKDRPMVLNTDANVPASPPEEKEISPNTRRNRDLARVLFGAEDEVKDEPTEDETIRIKPAMELVDSNPPLPTIPVVPSISQTTEPIPTPRVEPVPSHPPTSPYLNRNPSTSRIPQTPQEQAALTREVQQKTEAAMVALNKNPSKTNVADLLKYTPSIRRRVDPSQISTPTLVSTTTSVETMPLRSPSVSSNNSGGTSKLGSRFKKLRGSLRAKNLVSSGEETVTSENVKSPPPESQTAHYDPAKLNPPGAPKLSSATETGRFKVPVPSPPASAGPGLKGFMARFRNKQRMSETSAGSDRSMPRATSPLSPVPPLTPTIPKQATLLPSDRNHNMTPRPTPSRPMYSRFPPANSPAQATPPPVVATPVSAEDSRDVQNTAALEQLFRAAKDLGLDGNALNDLLARSGSTSSPNFLPRNNSTAAPGSRPAAWKDSEHVPQVSYVPSDSSQQTATPTNYQSLSNEEQSQQSKSDAALEVRPATPESAISRKPSVRKPDHLRRPKEGQTENAATTVVRRTLVYANDISSADFAALVQRKNSARRRRGSVTSTSARSVHDRAPTPPPPKTPTIKRFSADGLPPMPQMPNIRGQTDKLLNPPSTSASGPIEKSNSTYDSLYDMYAGESRVTSIVASDPTSADQQSNLEPGPALEFITLANGETIWNIVNGLRDGDDESIYSGRASFASEYSTRETTNEGGVQVFMKEHVRAGSKGSLSSFVSKKKPLQGKLRPETKVFYSSSAQIGQLIENLSQGADSGSFNFMPNLSGRGPGHSASSSLSTNDINWTVEERLERMLGAMNPST